MNPPDTIGPPPRTCFSFRIILRIILLHQLIPPRAGKVEDIIRILIKQRKILLHCVPHVIPDGIAISPAPLGVQVRVTDDIKILVMDEIDRSGQLFLECLAGACVAAGRARDSEATEVRRRPCQQEPGKVISWGLVGSGMPNSLSSIEKMACASGAVQAAREIPHSSRAATASRKSADAPGPLSSARKAIRMATLTGCPSSAPHSTGSRNRASAIEFASTWPIGNAVSRTRIQTR